MKKLVVLMLVLGMASLASAAPVMKLGDTNGAFTTGSSTVEVSAGTTYDLFVWASNDIPVEFDTDEAPIGTSGLDIIQVFLQYDTAKVNLSGGLITNLRAMTGNPYGTAWSGRSQGTYNSLGFAEGALLPASNVDTHDLVKVMRITVTVSNPSVSTTVAMLQNVAATHQSFQGNSMDNDAHYFAVEGSMTFLPEPMTLVLLGLGGLFLRRRK